MARDLIGQTLSGRYQFEATAGEGTFARVYRVHDTRRSVDLAAKVLRTDIAHDQNFVERFRREGDVLSRLQHPNIVRYYDLVDAEGYVFILMEYVPGQTLQSTLYRLGQPLSPRSALEFLRPLSAALHFAHGEGVIHRDLKPANVLMHENGNLLVTDFGIARILDDAAMSLTGGRALGTPLYMAPEQISGKDVSAATDVYALGVILYQMLTTNVPFDGSNPQSKGETTSERVTYEHLNIPPRSMRSMVPELDEAVDVIVMQCLEKSEKKRPQSVRAVYDLLAEAVGKVPFDIEEIDGAGEGVVLDPPAMKLPEVSQFALSYHTPELEETAEEPIQQPDPELNKVKALPIDNKRKTEENPIVVAKKDDPSATLKSTPYANTDSRQQDVVRAPSPSSTPPPFQQPAYQTPHPSFDDPYYDDEGIGFDPMRFLLIGVAVAVLACLALVIYAFGLFSGDEETPDVNPVVNTQTVDNGATATLLPTNASLTPALGPVGSSDGNLIAYASRRTGVLQLYTISSTGANRRQILDLPNLQQQGPAWSPDGLRLAFYGYEGDSVRPSDIYVVNADGTGLLNLTNSADYNDRYVTWSPDGRLLVFHSNRPGQDDSRDYEIYSINIETQELIQLTFNGVPDYGPDFSPDGTKIAFYSYVGSQAVLEVMDADGENRKQISPDSIDGGVFYPAWSPDGSQLAFHVEMSPQVYQVYVMNADGTNAHPLMQTYVNDQFPDWSPDGKSIIFQRVENEVPSIYRYDIDLDNLQKISSGLGDFLPDWQPIY